MISTMIASAMFAALNFYLGMKYATSNIAWRIRRIKTKSYKRGFDKGYEHQRKEFSKIFETMCRESINNLKSVEAKRITNHYSDKYLCVVELERNKE